jgi:hypothetical protein
MKWEAANRTDDRLSGHSSVQTTERYPGTEQDFADAACDRLGIAAKPQEI